MPTGTTLEPLQHAFFSPPFREAKVHDAMRLGVFSCPRDLPLADVARMMATYRVHSVVVAELEGDRPWGIVSDSDLVAAAAGGRGATAGEVASTELLTIAADAPLPRAAQMMAEHELTHLVVVQPRTGHPVGVLSTLDIAGVLAWGGQA